MPLFRAKVATPQFTPATSDRCTRTGCPDPAVTDCHYVDRDGDACGTSWCLDHLEVMGDEAYCIRHSGIMRALHGTALAGHRPPVGNRAASLVSWVANDMDQRI